MYDDPVLRTSTFWFHLDYWLDSHLLQCGTKKWLEHFNQEVDQIYASFSFENVGKMWQTLVNNQPPTQLFNLLNDDSYVIFMFRKESPDDQPEVTQRGEITDHLANYPYLSEHVV